METMEVNGDAPPPQSQPQLESGTASFDEGFENFFNNQTLSDRVLYICETEKVECYSGGAPCGRSKRKNVVVNDEGLENCLFKRIKQEDTVAEEAGCSYNTSVISLIPCHTNTNNNNSIEVSTNPLIQQIKIEEDTDYDVMEILPTSSEDTQHVVGDDEIVDEENHADEQQQQAGDVEITENAAAEPARDDFDITRDNVELTRDKVELTKDNVEGHKEDESSPTSRRPVENELQTPEGGEKVAEASSTVPEEQEETQQQIPADEVVEETTFDPTSTSIEESTPQPVNVPKRTYTLETKVLRETRVFVHSIILAAKSEFFKCLFSTSGMKETNQQEVKLEVGRNETDTLLTMLRCFYNRNYINRNSLDVVIKVCHMAMKYCFDGLIDKCLDVFANRSCQITETEDFNRINNMIDKIKTGFSQHKPKCQSVQSKCHEFILKHFQKLDDCFEVTPCKLFQLQLESMSLFINPNVQRSICNQHAHGNMFLYVMQRWVKFHVIKHNLYADDEANAQLKLDTLSFIEKLLRSVSLTNITTDFLNNVLNYEISSFNIWPGYKEWYIRALQNHLFNNLNNRPSQNKTFPALSRQRELKCTRQERNADIFSMTPVIVNGFEIGIYLRIREDRKVHMLCKCKNFFVNKMGFDKAVLTFCLKGLLKLNTNSTLWKEPFPRQFQSHPGAPMFNDRFTYSYKQSTMCLQMYSLCKLSPAVYNIAKRSGFLIEFEIQQLH